MAKKIKIFSQVFLGVASVLTLGYAINIKPASACVGADGKPIVGENGEVTNCVETIEVQEGDDGRLIAPAAETDDYSEAGADVKSEKTIRHSYFLAGNQVDSKDDIWGLAAFAGNGVVFSGSSEYAALAGNSILVKGDIENDLFVAGNAVELTEDAHIGRDVFGFGNTFLIKTNLNGNVFVSGNRLVLENVTIAGDLKVGFDEIVIKGKSAISGTFEYNDTAIVTGLDNLSADEITTYAGSKNNTVTFAMSLTDKIIFLLGRLLVTIIFIAIAKKFSKRIIDEFELKSAWKNLALGLGLLIVIPLASIFVMITFIGLPLGLIGFAFYALFAYLANSVTGGVIGHLLAEKAFKQPKMHIFLQYTIGIVLVELLTLIPYAGSLIGGISVCFGFGYLIHKIFRQSEKAKK